MRHAITIARLLLGLAFVVFGLDYFFHFMPPMGEPSAEGMAYLDALFATGFMFPLIKGIEVLAGVLLLSGFLVPLALALLAPLLLNIALYHLALDPNGLWLALVLAALELFLLWAYRDNFRALFELRAQPSE